MRNWTDQDIEAAYLLGTIRMSAQLGKHTQSVDAILADLTELKQMNTTPVKIIESLRYDPQI